MKNLKDNILFFESDEEFNSVISFSYRLIIGTLVTLGVASAESNLFELCRIVTEKE